jgi:hypothetical protein
VVGAGARLQLGNLVFDAGELFLCFDSWVQNSSKLLAYSYLLIATSS